MRVMSKRSCCLVLCGISGILIIDDGNPYSQEGMVIHRIIFTGLLATPVMAAGFHRPGLDLGWLLVSVLTKGSVGFAESTV